MFTIGVRAHDFGSPQLEELSKQISSYDFKSIQLALAKSFDGFGVNPGKITPGFANKVRQELYLNNIRIALLGCYINMGHTTKESLEWFKSHVQHARDFGTCIVGTETGSLNPDYSFHNDNFSEKAFGTFISNLEPLVEEAEKFGVFVGLEGVADHIINTPERMKRVLDTINSSNIKIIFDPINLITKDNYTNQQKLISDAFELYGDRISIIHAKDFVMENGIKKSKTLGNGIFDYKFFLKLLSQQKPYIDILIEEESPASFKQSYNFLKDLEFQL